MTKKTVRLIPTALTLALALSGAGCLEKKTVSTAYVEADGTVTWTILETGVRSDRTDPLEARQEEDEYLAEHQGARRSRLAAVLAAIGGRDVQARLLHATVPFEVHVTARFDSLEGLVGGYCAARAWWCASTTETAGDETTWTWTVTVADTGDQAPGGDDTLDSLDEAVAGLRICLGAGRFVSASGFKLDGNRMAEIAPDGNDGERKEYAFRLTWRS